MIRLLLKLSLGLILLFALMIAVSRMQPNDDSAIRSFFTPPQGCATPCFMGIRPGVTTKDEALAILSANPGIMALKENTSAGQDSIEWGWKDWRSFVNGFEGDFLPGQVNLQNGIVSSISLWTNTTEGDFFLAFGRSDRSYSTISPTVFSLSSYSDLAYHAVYVHDGIEAVATTRCPIKRLSDLWYSTVTISWTAHPSTHDNDTVRGC